MTEEELPWYVLTFVAGGALTGAWPARAYVARLLAATVVFSASGAAWVVYGYARTGDVPRSVGEALAHAVLYGPGLLLFGWLPGALAFGLALAAHRRRARDATTAAL